LAQWNELRPGQRLVFTWPSPHGSITDRSIADSSIADSAPSDRAATAAAAAAATAAATGRSG
jgi:hypothetical protein